MRQALEAHVQGAKPDLGTIESSLGAISTGATAQLRGELSRQAAFVVVQDEERARLLADDNGLSWEQVVLVPLTELFPPLKFVVSAVRISALAPAANVELTVIALVPAFNSRAPPRLVAPFNVIAALLVVRFPLSVVVPV